MEFDDIQIALNCFNSILNKRFSEHLYNCIGQKLYVILGELFYPFFSINYHQEMKSVLRIPQRKIRIFLSKNKKLC